MSMVSGISGSAMSGNGGRGGTGSHQGNGDVNTQIKDMMRQKDLLDQLEQEREVIRQQMHENERVMDSRMAHLAAEKLNIETKVQAACIKIQRFVRMKIQRWKYLAYQD